jgi:nucleoside-diphosphate-sugar epimerase
MLRPQNVSELEELLSRPTSGVRETLQAISGDVVILGAGGKLGPTLARMVRRGLDDIGARDRRVIAVSRFSSNAAAKVLDAAGVEVFRSDLLDPSDVARLPEAPNVLYLVGQKFGTGSSPGLTWVTNAVTPAWVAERYRESRIVALSTGCVYPLLPVNGPGADESTQLDPPGEYAQSCVGRERVFEHYARLRRTPMCFVRLCYAIDLRYGVLLDLAQSIANGEPIDIGMGATNVIWQGDANARIIQCLGHTSAPPTAINVTGQERLRIRDLATRLGELLGRRVTLVGDEAATAWVWNADRSYEWFGRPTVGIDEMLAAVAHWVQIGGETLNRPTHFEVRDGRF